MKSKMSAIIVLFSIMSAMSLGCGPSLDPDGSIHSAVVSVDYRRTLAEMVEAGKYQGGVNDQLTDENFPIQRPGVVLLPVNVEVVLVHFDAPAGPYDREVSTNDVLKYMDKNGLRPARIEVLLAFGEKYPDAQQDFVIIAFGSSSVVPNKNLLVVKDRDYYQVVPFLASSYSGGDRRGPYSRYISLIPIYGFSFIDDNPVWDTKYSRFLAVRK